MKSTIVFIVLFATFALVGAALSDLGNMPNLADTCTGLSILCFFASWGLFLASSPTKRG